MEPAVGERIRAFLSEKGLRHTLQRDAIVQAAFGTNRHFTADELLEMAREIEPSVSRATVYRTLPLLIESGLLHEIDLGRGIAVYDPNFIGHPAHNHLICLDCDKIIEFEDPHLELLENCITRRLGFSPDKKSLRIEARCDELNAHGHCRHRAPK